MVQIVENKKRAAIVSGLFQKVGGIVFHCQEDNLYRQVLPQLKARSWTDVWSPRKNISIIYQEQCV